MTNQIKVSEVSAILRQQLEGISTKHPYRGGWHGSSSERRRSPYLWS